jgi:hypothetical protein
MSGAARRRLVESSHVVSQRRGVCPTCETAFTPTAKHARFCSAKCYWRRRATGWASKRCLVCAATFEDRSKRGMRYCSAACYRARPTQLIDHLCGACGKKMQVAPYDVARGKGRFCSKPCKSRLQARQPRDLGERCCQVCLGAFIAAGFDVRRGKARFCSRRCATAFLNDSYQWPRDARARAARRAVASAVKSGRLIRPRACVECDRRRRVEGHHDDYSQPLEVRWLCHSCHQKHHRSGSILAVAS